MAAMDLIWRHVEKQIAVQRGLSKCNRRQTASYGCPTASYGCTESHLAASGKTDRGAAWASRMQSQTDCIVWLPDCIAWPRVSKAAACLRGQEAIARAMQPGA